MDQFRDNKGQPTGRFRTFIFAINGLKYTFRSQLNFRIHLGIGIIAVICGVAVRLSASEWSILALTTGAVISMETMNTAIEKLVDLVSPDFRKEAGIIKDVAAGAVLVAAIAAVVTGLFLFLPKLL